MDAKEALKQLAKKGGKRNKPKGLPKRTGKRAAKYKKYFEYPRVERKKLRRIIRHNGVKAARRWAEQYQCEAVLAALL